MSLQNILGQAQSPYLLQHADNPVHWQLWGKAAFQQAREQDKPIFLSIGYATCHWCHVMAHESFEDETVAQLMNRAFINIKVDREERPDIDNTYMLVCQMLTRSGGWPLNIIMTPDKKPFYAATYIPKKGRQGRPGMLDLIPRIQHLWQNERSQISNTTAEIYKAFQQTIREETGAPLGQQILGKCFQQLSKQYDESYGGFGDAPKFPSPHSLSFLMRYWNQTQQPEALAMAERTLERMRLGGLFDHVGFGFHRYSTDREWLLPHFEKMLYDQAMLLMAYTEAWQITRNPLFKQTAEEIITYVLRDLQSKKGGFYSAEDADSEGEEGKFYVWTAKEIRQILPPNEANLALKCYNISDEGNFKDEATGRKTGKNILHLKKSIKELADDQNIDEGKLRDTLSSIRQKLFEERQQRIRPLLDDKILTDWNGLMIAALSKAGAAFDNTRYMYAAQQAADFISTQLMDGQDLLHRYRNGQAGIRAHADDYAFFIWGLRELYRATFNNRWLQQAVSLQQHFLDLFWDENNGGFFFTNKYAEKLLGRKKESYDGALPSANSVAVLNLLKLGKITANTEWKEKAEAIQKTFSNAVQQAPTGFTQLLQGINFQHGETFEITISGSKQNETVQQMIRQLHQKFVPQAVIVLNDADNPPGELAPYTKNQPPQNGMPTAYVCKNYSCKTPVNEAEEMMRQLNLPKA